MGQDLAAQVVVDVLPKRDVFIVAELRVGLGPEVDPDFRTR